VFFRSLFDHIGGIFDDNVRFEVQLTAVELHLENICDLFANVDNEEKLGIYQHPVLGVGIKGAMKHAISDFEELCYHFADINRAQAFLSSKWNKSSAQTTTIITAEIRQINAKTPEDNKISTLQFVDLKGLEGLKTYQESTRMTDDRLSGRTLVNQDLVILWECILKLAAATPKKKKRARVPFKKSVLTTLVNEALGASSRLLVFANITPLGANYDNTLFTLRFAEKLQRAHCRPAVNTKLPIFKDKLEHQLDRLSRKIITATAKEAHADIEQEGDDDSDGGAPKSLKALKEMLAEVEGLLADVTNLEVTWDERLGQTADAAVERAKSFTRMGLSLPEDPILGTFLQNIHPDPAFNGKAKFFTHGEKAVLGSRPAVTGTKTTSIGLDCLGIAHRHCSFSRDEEGQLTLQRVSKDSRTMLNGSEVTAAVTLKANDVLLFGQHYLMKVVDSTDHINPQDSPDSAWTEAMMELYAYVSKPIVNPFNKIPNLATTKSEAQPDVKNLLAVLLGYELTHLAIDLRRPQSFVAGFADDSDEQYIAVESGILLQPVEKWSIHKALNRLLLAREMYYDFVQCHKQAERMDYGDQEDPFYDPPKPQFIGKCNVALDSVSSLIESEDTAPIHSANGLQCGHLTAVITPLIHQKTGEPWVLPPPDPKSFDDWLENRMGEPFKTCVHVTSAQGIPQRLRHRIFVKYKFRDDKDYTCTEECHGSTTTPTWKRVLSHTETVSHRLITYMDNTRLELEVWGNPDRKPNELGLFGYRQARKHKNTILYDPRQRGDDEEDDDDDNEDEELLAEEIKELVERCEDSERELVLAKTTLKTKRSKADETETELEEVCPAAEDCHSHRCFAIVV
jgi:hypothetical protein